MMMPSLFTENLFDDFFNDFDEDFFGKKNPLYGKHARNMMKTDVRETDTTYEVDVDLPGFKKEDINVNYENGYLTISTSKGLDKDEKDKDGRYIRQERYVGNGSYVTDEDTVVMHQLITLEQCKHIVDWCHSRNVEFYLESNNGLFASENFEEKGNPVIKVYCQRKGKENASEQTVRTVFPEMIYGGELYRDDCNKVSFILNSYQDHLDSIKEFPDLKPGTWGGAGEIALFGDLGVKGIDKAHAIDELLKHLGASLEDTFAFGDAKVDIPMLEYCNVGVAVNSGGDEIKAMADYVTDDVDQDGIYKAFVHFGLIDDVLNLC